MIPEPRRLALLEAGKLKLAAKAKLAEGGDDTRYQAAVLYHAAARAEQRALLAREAPSPEAILATAIERCACLIAGLDASAVLESAWSDVLVASSALPQDTATAMRSKIEVKMSAFLATYHRVLAKTPRLTAWMASHGPLPALKSMAREVDRVLDVFPGDARFLAIRSWAHLEASEIDAAWRTIQRARQLLPDDTMLVQIELHLVPLHLPRARAEARLAGFHGQIERGSANADICFGFISAALQLAQKGTHRQELWRTALDAATQGSHAAASPDDRRFFRAIELGVRDLLAGRRPSVEILYRCGLGRLAAMAARKVDPMAIVLSRTTPFRRLDVAA